MLNQVQLIGRLGRDPEIRYLPSGDAVANISLATTEVWNDRTSGERREHTEWHRIAFFGRLAEVVGKYLKKASLVYVSGQLRTNTWTDSDGVERYSTDVRADTLRMLDRSRASNHPPEPGAETRRAPTTARTRDFDDITNDIPF